MTYQINLNYESDTRKVEADNFSNDKAGLIFYRGKDDDNNPVAVAFFPIGDVTSVTPVNEVN